MTDSPVDKSKKHGFPPQLNGKKSFVVVVDTQVDFMRKNGALYVPDAELIGPKINRFFSSLSPNDCSGVLFTFDTHYVDEYPLSEEALQFPPHCLFSTPGWALDCDYACIAKEIPKYMLYKSYFDMWKEEGASGLDENGKQQVNGNVEEAKREKDVVPFPVPRRCQGVKQSRFFAELKAEAQCVIVIGVASDICVKFAISGFLERGFHVITDRHLCAHIETPITDVCETLYFQV
jgi:nicotinamidase/pyrazinamidase